MNYIVINGPFPPPTGILGPNARRTNSHVYQIFRDDIKIVGGTFGADYQACKATALKIARDKGIDKPISLRRTTMGGMDNYLDGIAEIREIDQRKQSKRSKFTVKVTRVDGTPAQYSVTGSGGVIAWARCMNVVFPSHTASEAQWREMYDAFVKCYLECEIGGFTCATQEPASKAWSVSVARVE